MCLINLFRRLSRCRVAKGAAPSPAVSDETKTELLTIQNLNTMPIVQVAGSIRPRTTDTPTDARQRVATLADIDSIDLPFVGMLIYCVATDKYYKVTALNEDEDAIDTYEELATGGGSSAPSMTAVPHSGATPGTVTVNGGEYHTFSDAIDSLTIASGSSNPYAESHLEFSTSANFTAVTWPSGCKFANQEPMLAASSSYLVSILHGIIAVTEVVAS